MRQQISFLTQSRFYSPAFNAAIFDGPVRIYFAQYQESQALKVYFKSQQRLKDVNSLVREAFRRMGVNIFVMLYPNQDTFQMSFADLETEALVFGEAYSTTAPVVVARLGRDFIVGASGQFSDSDVDQICERVYEIAKSLLDVIPENLMQSSAEEVSL